MRRKNKHNKTIKWTGKHNVSGYEAILTQCVAVFSAESLIYNQLVALKFLQVGSYIDTNVYQLSQGSLLEASFNYQKLVTDVTIYFQNDVFCGGITTIYTLGELYQRKRYMISNSVPGMANHFLHLIIHSKI